MFCDCGHDSSVYSLSLTPTGPRTRCRACQFPRRRESVSNPFASLRLDHAHDEQGNPVEVSSLRQLQMAEKRFRFKSVVANTDATNFDKPLQTKPKSVLQQMDDPWTDSDGVFHDSHWLHPEVAREMICELEAEGEI